ncbi:Telomere repeat-binding factor 1 [Forsythia ovata]|uniref:Telomere repeat-binding factor 1 n=1 Tax=Forsythia ovata TaxID=205694 RepID=A0ABD1TLD1_9LAMI
MGEPKQKWTPEEEAADKWRNMSGMESECSSRERTRLALKMMDQAPKLGESSVGLSTVAQGDEEMADTKVGIELLGCDIFYGIGSYETDPKEFNGSEDPNSASLAAYMGTNHAKKTMLDNLIVEVINNLRESGGSNKTTMAAYIKNQYWAPPNFKRILSTKLKHLAATGKLIKVKRKYRLATNSAMSQKRMALSVPLPEGRWGISPIIDWDDVSYLTKSQIDLELAKMWRMTPEEAAAAAAQAVADAEAAVAKAEEAVKEAEEAEAEAALLAFAAALKMMKRKNSPMMGSAKATEANGITGRCELMDKGGGLWGRWW